MLICLLLESAQLHEFGLLEKPVAREPDPHGLTMCEECEERNGGPGLLKHYTLEILELPKVFLCCAF